MGIPKSKIAYYRRINFLTQKEVAKYCGISQQYYNKIENGNCRLSIEIAVKLKELFKLSSIDELLGEVA